MIHLYTWGTPNGHKASIMLEECGLPYQVTAVNLMKKEQNAPAFLAVNPNAKIPAIVDDGTTIFESCAIVHHLAERTGRFLPADAAARSETMRWFLWLAGSVAPTSGLAYFLTRRPDEAPGLAARRREETAQILDILERRLGESAHIGGAEYSIADVLAIPMVKAALWVVESAEPGRVQPWPHLRRWLAAMLERPAVQRGMAVPAVP